ncbi:hypothetical protein [Haloechinothrix halophila]|uniref:hypothetical protein n=1 Tax=Haloechinothrix halophila TaxID=1069073 RepID=UPI000424DC57|nr:hypothetical protein [Haloechinothrix halophila]
MDFDAVADELYSGPREEFIRRRNARAAEAEDRSLAARIKALRKPTLAAWLVNRLAREHPDDLAELAALGQELRAAHEELAGGRLRELSVRRREIVDALTLTAREIGREAGLGVSEAVTDQVHATLQAALAGGDAADLVAAGRLATPLDPSDARQWLTAGTLARRAPEADDEDESGEADDETAARAEPGEQPSGGARRTSRGPSGAKSRTRPGTTTRATVSANELRRRREGRERAKRDAEAAKARRDEAAATLAEAHRRAKEATEEVAELRAKLVKAQRYEKLARNAVRAAQLELGTAERESDRTERALRRQEPPP